MYSTADSIVAIATPPGRGGLGVVRLSGPNALQIATAILTAGEPLVPRRATFTRVKSVTPAALAGETIDQVVATYFPEPASYTREDVVEISAHGSPVVLRQIVAAAMRAGARLAEPGEFTLRAFLNGRVDLVQAEAVADLIDAVTPLQARAALDQLEGTLTGRIREIDAALFDLAARFEASLDFPDEGYHFVEAGTAGREMAALEARVAALLGEAARGRLIREGAQVAIIGKPNAGKSSLFNALVGADRAIVAPVPGTTRDFITEQTDIEGLRLTMIDTAGERGEEVRGSRDSEESRESEGSEEAVERAGVRLARGVGEVADLALVVLDRSRPLEAIDRAIVARTANRPRVVVANKSDLTSAWCLETLAESAGPVLPLSARTREGLDEVRAALARALNAAPGLRDTAAVTNLRHIDLLERARVAMARAREAVEASQGALSEEFVLADLQEARHALEEITGRRTADDLLAHIFGRFCVGK